MEREEKDKKKEQKANANGAGDDAEMEDKAAEEEEEEQEEDVIDAEILHSSTRDILMRKRLLDNDMRIMMSEFQRLTHEQNTMKEKIKDNLEKIENNRYGIVRWNLSDHGLTALGNYRISLATWSSYWIWMWKRRLRKREPISIWTPREWANPLSSRPLRDRLFSCRLLGSWTR